MGAFQAGLILLRMEDYLKAKDLSGMDVLVLATLFSFAADDARPQAFPSTAKIATRSRLGQRTVQRSLGHLEEVGAITGGHRHRRPTRWSLDAYFIKAAGVTATPDPGGSRPTRGGAGSATAAQTYVRETQGLRQSGGQHTSERRTADVTEAHQGTEVGSGAKRRNRTDVRRGGGSGKPARSARRAPSAPPPSGPGCGHGTPDGLTVRSDGRFTCEKCEAIAPHPDQPEFRRWVTPELEAHLVDNVIKAKSSSHGRLAAAVAETVWLRTTPRNAHTYRLLQAWAVEQSEPGRVAEALANAGCRKEIR